MEKTIKGLHEILCCENCAQWTPPKPGKRLGKCQRKRVDQLAEDPMDNWPKAAASEFCRDWSPNPTGEALCDAYFEEEDRHSARPFARCEIN